MVSPSAALTLKSANAAAAWACVLMDSSGSLQACSGQRSAEMFDVSKMFEGQKVQKAWIQDLRSFVRKCS